MAIDRVTRQPVPRRPCEKSVLLLCSILLALVQPAVAQTWIDANPGSWYDPTNWSTGVVPAAGGAVLVSNGGAALLDTVASGGASTTPQLSSLTVGLLGSGTGRGAVTSAGVDLLAGILTVGSGLGAAGSFADGVVTTTAAGVSATASRIGVLFNAATASNVNGRVVVDGLFQAGGGAFEIAQMFQAAAGSSADGRLHATNLSGTVGGSFWIVGNVTANDASQIGSRSFGEVVATEGGTLTLASGSTTFIGTTFGLDRVSDAGGTRINEATGIVRLAGTLEVQQFGQQQLLVGRTAGGRVDGTLEVGTLAMGANRFGNVQVGTSGAQGQASGRLTAGSGNLQHGGSLSVGTSTNGSAQGEVQLGGALLGDGTGAANVGTASGSAGQLVQAQGTVVAAGGFAGYSGINVGTLFGDVAAGSQAVGRMVGSVDAGAATTGSVLVGRMSGNTSGSALTDGELRSAGALGMGGGTLEVAQMFGSAAGSSARGVVELGGDVGTVGGSFLVVGNITANNDSQVGSQSFGELVAGGDMTLASGSTTFIGTTFGLDRVSDAGGTRINEATGIVRLAGTLEVQQFGQQQLWVGRTGGGRVDGTLEVGRVEMGANSFSNTVVASSINGDAVGRLQADGGTLRTGTLQVGVSSSGTADGSVALRNTTLEAGSVNAGAGTGNADIALTDSAAAIFDDFMLGSGRLALERSLVSVGGTFRLGGASTLLLMFDNDDRGTGYGAVDALIAELDGELALDLTSYLFGSGAGVFDLVRAGVAGSIQGDFSGVVFAGLAAGWQAFTGVEFVNGQEIYRLRLSAVPEPGSIGLVLLAIGMLAVAMRRRQARAARFAGRT